MLDSRHTMSVLLYLLENGRSNRTSIYADVSRSSSMAGRLDDLVDMGLLKTSVTYRGVFMDLTENGRLVAEHLAIIEDALKGKL